MRKLTYFKRHRMELDLRHPLPPAGLPAGFAWAAWDDDRLGAHAAVMYRSFHQDLDAAVFPSFNSPAGCRELMLAIRGQRGFCPGATWLVVAADGEPVGTVQGIIDRKGHGGVQNLGVVPDHRGKGLGRALLLAALAGFVSAGSPWAFLEVTARNSPAVRMYRDLGFRNYRTTYRGVELPEPSCVGAGL